MWRGEVGVENGDVVEAATTTNLRIQGFRFIILFPRKYDNEMINDHPCNEIEFVETVLSCSSSRSKVTALTAMGAATDIKMRGTSVEEKMIRKLKVSPPQVRPQFSGLFAPLVSAS